MGNKNCCVRHTPSISKKKSHENHTPNHIFNGRDSSVNFLPHISEREIPDDTEQDPSTHPSVRPTFVERSRSELKLRDNRRSFYVLDLNNLHAPVTLKKSNSCSTIYMDDSTISQPHLKNTIICVSLAVFYHIINRKHRGKERLMEIFEERLHPITHEPVAAENFTRDPEHRQIYRFIRTLFHAAQLTAECAIITLVYIERLLNYELCLVLLYTNVDDMNELERQFLESLEFNINVPSSIYAKYYYDLRTLAIANDIQLPLQPLYKERAARLEALSRNYEDKVALNSQKLSKSMSAERLREHRSPAIIP
uniref:CYCLIN domain-containing protein n=1 Tax=Globodera pallida TaxID=36090 RepID=A0A183BRW7_GLOPA